MVEPESEEMNTRVLILRGVEAPQVGERGAGDMDDGDVERESRCWAVRRGPIVFVFRWWAKDWNVLVPVSFHGLDEMLSRFEETRYGKGVRST